MLWLKKTLFLWVCFSFLSIVHGQTIDVNPCNGTGDLQDALNALTTTNQTILVDPASYNNASPGGNWGLSTLTGTGGTYDGLTIDFQGAYVTADAVGLGLLDISDVNNITIKNLTLDGFNRSTGAINVNSCEGAIFDNVKFVNSPTTQPMSISSTSGNTSVTFKNCLFSGNPVTSASTTEVANSGAIQIQGDDIYTLDVTFEHTQFRCNARSGAGGAVQILGDGGAADRTYTTVTFTDCEFANNFTSSSIGGGAIYIDDQSTVNISETTFYNNNIESGPTNSSGGAIFANGEVDLNITNSYFVDNSSNGGTGSGDGGAIGTQGSSSNKNNVSITGCVFTGNSCLDEGGAVFFRHAQTVNVTNCLFANNTSPDGGAFHIDNAGNYTIDGLTVTGTSGLDFENNSGTGTISNSIITGSNDMESLTQTNCTIGSAVTFTNPMPSGTTDPATYNYDVTGTQGSSIGVMPSVTSNTDCPSEKLTPPAVSSPCDALGVISGNVFLDNYGDGTTGNQDGSSFGTLDGLAGGVDAPLNTTVYLYSCTVCDGSDDVLEKEVTTTTGAYSFMGLGAGNYFIHYDTPTEYEITTLNTTNGGATAAVDSDNDMNTSHVITVEGGNNYSSNDADASSGFSIYSNINSGFYEPITVEGTLYADASFTFEEANASFDLTVGYSDGTSVTLSSMSDGDGLFSITGFPPGNITSVTSSFGSIDQSTVIGGSSGDGTAAGPPSVLQASGTTLSLQDFALPVELISFQGKRNTSGNLLSWQTASEENTWMYMVERAENGRDFTEIGKVEAAGNATTVLDYQFLDAQPLNQSYYRLKMVDLDGSFEYSNIILLQMDDNTPPRLTLQPNPTQKNIAFSWNATTNSPINLSIVSMTGQVVQQKTYHLEKGQQDIQLDTQSLPQGVYYLSVQEGQKRPITARFIKE